MPATVTISRTRLGLPPLHVNTDPTAASGIELVKFGPGERTMDARYARSPVSDGAVLLTSTADVQRALLTVRAWGTTDDIWTLLNSVESAVSQLEYTLTITHADGTVLASWSCGPADTAWGAVGTVIAEDLNAGWQDLEIDLPRAPDARPR